MSAIATLDEVKTYIGLSGTASDTLLGLLTAGVLPAMGAYCNRVFQSTLVQGYRDGNGASRMQLAQYPITSVSTVKVDNVVIPAQPSPGQAGYFFQPHGRSLALDSYDFGRGNLNVYLSYTGGYGDGAGPGGADIEPWPADLKLAYLIIATTWYRKKANYGVSSKSLAGESISVSDSTGTGALAGIPAEARSILENYMNVIPEVLV